MHADSVAAATLTAPTTVRARERRVRRRLRDRVRERLLSGWDELLQYGRWPNLLRQSGYLFEWGPGLPASPAYWLEEISRFFEVASGEGDRLLVERRDAFASVPPLLFTGRPQGRRAWGVAGEKARIDYSGGVALESLQAS